MNFQYVRGPDGKKLAFPAGMSRDEIAQAIEERFANQGLSPLERQVLQFDRARKPNPYGEAFENREPASRGERFQTGVTDPFWGMTQLASRAMFGKAPIDSYIQERESDYQRRRGDDASTFDPARLLGNVVSPMNYGPGRATTAMAGPGRGMVRNAAAGGVGGSLGGLMAPATGEGNFLEEKEMQAALGAAGGGIIGAAGTGAGRMIAPKSNKHLALLKREGVNPTVGRHLGHAGKFIEDMGESIPFAGSAIVKQKGEVFDEFNRAAYNRVLAPLGIRMKKDQPVGTEAIRRIGEIISEKYDEAYANLRGVYDKPLRDAVRGAKDEISIKMPKKVAREFKQKINSIVKDALPSDKFTSGRRLQAVMQELKAYKQSLVKSEQFGSRFDGETIPYVQRIINEYDDMLNRTNSPEAVAAKDAINKSYRQFKAVQNASTGKDEAFTPARLMQGIRQADKSKGKARFKEGTGAMQDLAQAGVDVLPRVLPDSGTATRQMLTQQGPGFALGGIGMGTGMIDPLTAGTFILGATAPYTTASRKLLSHMLTERPELLQEVGRRVGGVGLMAAPGVGTYTGASRQ